MWPAVTAYTLRREVPHVEARWERARGGSPDGTPHLRRDKPRHRAIDSKLDLDDVAAVMIVAIKGLSLPRVAGVQPEVADQLFRQFERGGEEMGVPLRGIGEAAASTCRR